MAVLARRVAVVAHGDPVEVLMIGAGQRAHAYASYADLDPRAMDVVAVADPDGEARERLATRYAIPADARFTSVEVAIEALEAGAFRANAAINTTPDREHVATTLVLLAAGLDVLLEKPVGTSRDELETLVGAVARYPDAVTRVCHVLRYTSFYAQLRSIVQSGLVGSLVAATHTERISYWHFAHSYVRGNWRRADTSSPLMLAKCCHDLDILAWTLGVTFTEAIGAGARRFFNGESAPPGSTARCGPDCAVADTCIYNAETIYGIEGDVFPADVLERGGTRASRLAALVDSPYGRCVYHCDNDVPESETALFRTDTDLVIPLHISGHADRDCRITRIDGTEGSIEARFFASGTRSSIDISFPDGREETWRVDAEAASSGHGGGDMGLVAEFIDAVRERDTEGGATIRSALPSHYAALAAEESRSTGTWVVLPDPV